MRLRPKDHDSEIAQRFLLLVRRAHRRHALTARRRLAAVAGDAVKGPWIRCSEKLPPLNRYVLGYYVGDNWIDDLDDPNRIVVMRVKERHLPGANPNNLGAPYSWDAFGGETYFARDITHWARLPRRPRKAA